jgi:hypothetical protein
MVWGFCYLRIFKKMHSISGRSLATTHCSFLRLQIKREDIIDKCRECDKDRSIHNFTGCLYRVKQINLHSVVCCIDSKLSEMEILAQPLSLRFIIENLKLLPLIAIILVIVINWINQDLLNNGDSFRLVHLSKKQ